MKSWIPRTVLVLLMACTVVGACWADSSSGYKFMLGTWECKDKAGHERITFNEKGRYRRINLDKKGSARDGYYTYVDENKLLFLVELESHLFYSLAWKSKDQFTATEVKTKESRVWKRVK